MEYAAKHYVKITGQKFMPGEIIDIPIPEDKLPRLLKIGAVIPLAPTAPITAVTDDGKENAPSGHDNRLEDMSSDSFDESKESPDEAESSVETDEDAEVPEIDVMDGIVAEDAENAPAKTTAKKPAKNSRAKNK